LHARIWRKLRDRVLVCPAAPKQRAGQGETGRSGVPQMHLHSDLGHARPGAEEMRDAVAAEAGKILGRKKLRIADLDCVAEVARQRGQERIELLEKRAGVGEALPRETAEFEN